MKKNIPSFKLFFITISVLLLSINFAKAAVPKIGYTSPAAYTAGTAIATLSPTNSGGAVSAFGYNTTPITSYNSGINGAFNLATDAAGNLYVANVGGNVVTKISTAGVSSTFINTNVNQPIGIAFDAAGNAYVANYAGAGGSSTITKYTSAGVYISTIRSGGFFYGIDVDASGNIWVADAVYGVYEFSSTGTQLQLINYNVNSPTDVSIDNSGNVYVANYGNGTITEFNSAGTYLGTPITGLNNPWSVYVDPAGTIYATSYGSGTVIMKRAGSASTTTTFGSASGLTGIVTDPQGYLYLVSYNNNTIYKYEPTGGYYLSGTLPAGLSFSASTGQVTGTPTAVWPTTSYTVYAYNGSGQSNPDGTFSITVNPPAPTTTPGSTCGTGPVTLTAGGETITGGTYNWYTAATGGTLLQSTTSNTYSPTISATTTYYVSYTVGGQTSASRTSVVATYNAEPVLSVAPTGTGSTLYLSYPFTASGNTATTTADISGNGTVNTGLTGTTEGSPQQTVDRFGVANNAYSFNGTNQYIATTTSTVNPGPANFSISVWFKTTTAGGMLVGFGGSQTGSSANYDRHIYMDNSGHIYYGIYNTGVQVIESTATYIDGNWHHVVATQSSTTGAVLYIDGAVAGTNTAMTVCQSYTGYWRIGYDNMGGWTNQPSNYYFTGSLDDIAVYNSAITPAQVYTLYGAGSPAACSGSPLTLQANTVTGATYSWTGPNSFTSTSQYPVVDATASSSDLGTYVLTVTASDGCQYQQNVTPQINADPTPAFTATSSVTVNANATITYTGTVVSGDTYAWNFGGGTPATATGSGPFTVKWATAGAKTVTLTETNSTGCSTVVTQSVIVGGLDVTANNYAFSQNISLNTSSITGGITTTLSNFPALVYIQENALIVNAASPCAQNLKFPAGGTNGYDFAFTMQGSNTELYYQVESYDQTTGALLAWVNVPTVTSTNAQLTFYFGSATPNHTTAFTQNTWPSDYMAVYHFDEGALSTTAGYVKDATSNAKNLTQSASGVTLAASEVRNAAGITAANSAYVFKGAGSLTNSVGISPPGNFTLSAWVNLNAIGHDQKVMTNQTSSIGGFKLGVYNNNIPESETTGAINRGDSPVAPTIGTSAWHYLQTVFDGTKIVTYVDGNEYQVNFTTSGSANSNPYYIGVGENGNQYYFYGTISEARVSSAAKTSDWINAEYYNQANPKTFTIVNTYIAAVLTGGFAINAQAIGASIQYNWVGVNNDADYATNWYCYGSATTSGTTTGSLNIAPPYNGSSSLNIPTSTNYPVLSFFGTPVNEAIYSLTLGAGAQIYLNNNTLTVGCHIYNNASPGGIISSGSSSSSTVTPYTSGGISFNGIGALSGQPQYFYGSTTSTVNLANIVEANSSASGSLSITGGPVNIYSSLGITAGNITVAPSSTVTLVSTAAGSANVLTIPTGNTISGNLTVQRYIPGGTGYRSYRLITLPVNTVSTVLNQTTTEGFIDLHSLNTGVLTAGPGGGFSYATATTNPLSYLYDESRARNFTAYVAGKNVGIYSWAGSTAVGATPAYNVITYGTSTSAAKTTAQVPVGNSIQMYFVGPNTAANLTASAPLAATSVATGVINQGTIPMYIYNHTNKFLSYTLGGNNTATPALVGLNQVGNPYPSTIDLDSVYYDNRGSSPYTTSISPVFWALKQPNNTFVAYNASSHAASVSGSGASTYIASGQGFYVDALSTSSTLTFSENEKVNVQLGTSTTPVLILSQKGRSENSAPSSYQEIIPGGLAGLHLKITKDSLNYTETGIYFNSVWSDKFLRSEDGVDLDGPAPVVYLSSYSSDGMRLSINQLGDYSKTARKVVQLYASATSSGTYTISLTDINNIDNLYNVYLRDHKLNDSVEMRTTGKYSFAINTGDTTSYGANRFDVVLERQAVPPYQLLTFTGQKVTQGVQLAWTALNPGNYTGYILQKKNADGTFTPIYTVQSNSGSDYNFIDSKPVPGDNVYRLVQNDINGTLSYSSLITIGYNNVSLNGYFSLYPNPSKDIINILINSTTPADVNYTADIYNTSGVLMDHRVLNTNSWTEDISSYKEGVYIIALKNMNGDVLAKSKFIKTK